MFKVGDKVRYIPYKGAVPKNGIIKEIPNHTDEEVRVVYHCNDEWDNYKNYTSQLTPIDKLILGWE